MRKSTIPFLVINLLLLIVVNACGSANVVKDYTATPITKAIYEAPYFSNSETDYVYKTNISVYGNEMSGIFIAKKINETTHRVVFTTEFGNKLFDFEISETDFKINAIIAELDKKILLTTLKKDFRLLLKKQFTVQGQFENATQVVFKSDDRNQFNYLFVSKSDGKLLKIVHASKRKEKISISFASENNFFAKNSIIQHYNIPLKIELNYFKSN